jgi:hypothetical protein
MEAGSSPAPSAKNYNMWLKESNRPKHLLYAIPAAFVGTILFSTGLAFGMEFKDKQWGGKFDRLDIAATEIGGLIGQALQIGVISLFV